MKIYQALAAAFSGEGVTSIFGIMGDGNMYWMSEIEKTHPKMRIYEGRHEGACLAMADGWARVSGEPGVCAVTCGPGLAQLATSLLVASRARTPCVVFAGDTPDGSLTHSQRLNQARFAEACEAGFVKVTTTDGAFEMVRRAFNQARVEGRPVIVSAAMDLQLKEYDGPETYVSSKAFLPAVPPLQPDPSLVAAAAKLIAESKRPVIIAGRGASRPTRAEAILRLGDRIGALLATTLLAKTYLAEAEFHAGIAGVFAPHETTELLSEADCVIGVGASLNTYTLESGYLFPDARFVQIDTAPQIVMGTGKVADCFVRGDARLTVDALDKALAAQGFTSKGYRTPESLEKLRAEIDPAHFDIPDGTVDPRVAASVLDEMLHRPRSGWQWASATISPSRPCTCAGRVSPAPRCNWAASVTGSGRRSARRSLGSGRSCWLKATRAP